MATAIKATWTRHVGDVNDTLEVEVSRFLGDDLSLVSSVSGVARHRVTGAETVLTAAVSDSANRVVKVTLGSWLQSTVAAGDEYYISLSITTSDSRTVTAPERLEQRPILAIV